MSSDELTRLRQQLTTAANRAYNRGLQYGDGGNISACAKQGIVVITASGQSLGDCTPTHCLRFTMDEDAMAREPNPSRDFFIHRAIYQEFPEIRAIIHTHSPFCAAFAVSHREIPILTLHGRRKLGERIPLLPTAPEASAELQAMILEHLRKTPSSKVVLLQDHGVMAFGRNPLEAEHVLELAEESAQIALGAEFLKRKKGGN